MAAFIVTIQTPMGEKQIGVNNPPGQSAEGAKAEIERQQKIISESSGLPFMPPGEIKDVRPAVWPEDFSKRPSAMVAQNPNPTEKTVVRTPK